MVFRPNTVALSLGIALAFLGATGCGGSGSGDGSGDGNPILLSFRQAGQDNVAVNSILTFEFSGPIDPATVGPASIQVRQGNAFGLTVPGTFEVSGNRVRFFPRLPGLCDYSDSGFRPSLVHRVTIVGYPEEFALRGPSGDPLDQTYTYEFTTRPENEAFDDQVPGTAPALLSSSPADGQAAVTVHGDDPITSAFEGNELVLVVSENLDPCTVNDATILVHEYERGSPSMPLVDGAPGNPYVWGGQAVTPPQRISSRIFVEQSFSTTLVRVRPDFGEWPDDALIVVELTFGITDFGGNAFVPTTVAFTTEDRPPQDGYRHVTFEGETPILLNNTTADVNTTRAPSRAQGFLLFAGDGDNGGNVLLPSRPGNPPVCAGDRQLNDGTKDDFDPATSVLLDTGLTLNTCVNATDGSTAVIWEFQSFRIRSGVIVRLVGTNPAILLVQGDVLIEAGGILRGRGDGTGAPTGAGGNGITQQQVNAGAVGGKGVAGGGRGGDSRSSQANAYGEDGTAGFGSPQQFQVGGLGGGQGNVGSEQSGNFTIIAATPSGGGGGHAVKGADGTANVHANNTLKGAPRGAGGGPYPTTGANIDAVRKPSAGSGGGAAGFAYELQFPIFYPASGGAGGAGGGFLDITSSGNIRIFGTLDVAGGRGGNGVNSGFSASGGGGGGSGGGIRLLTPNDIDVSGGTLTAAGGLGGTGPGLGGAPANNGGAGAFGRMALEDGDSLVTGIGAATMVPSEGSPGFYRSTFDASRFVGGGLRPGVLTDLILAGPTSPTFVDPVPADFPETLFGTGAGPGAGIPAATSLGLGTTGILIEARGYTILADGTPDLASQTAYYTVGYFKDSGQENAPTWVPAAYPGDIGPRPADNAGDGIANLSGNAFLQLRITFFLPSGVGPTEPGPFLNLWRIHYTYDQ